MSISTAVPPQEKATDSPSEQLNHAAPPGTSLGAPPVPPSGPPSGPPPGPPSGTPIDGLFDRVVEKAKSDADTAELLSMLKAQTEQVNTFKKETEKKDKETEKKEAIYKRAIEEAGNTLKAKLADSRLDKKSRAFFSKWIDEAGAEQYLIHGTDPFEPSTTTAAEPEEKQLPPTPPIPPPNQPKPRPATEFDPRELAREYRQATFTDIKTGVVTPPMERKPRQVAPQEELVQPTLEQMIRERFANNSFAQALLKNNQTIDSLRQLDSPMIQASGCETVLMTEDQKEQYWKIVMENRELAKQYILYGSSFPQIGSKRRI